jgi:hypothetical protein
VVGGKKSFKDQPVFRHAIYINYNKLKIRGSCIFKSNNKKMGLSLVEQELLILLGHLNSSGFQWGSCLILLGHLSSSGFQAHSLMSDIRINASLIRILKKHHECISFIRNRVLIYFTSGLGSNMYPISTQSCRSLHSPISVNAYMPRILAKSVSPYKK